MIHCKDIAETILDIIYYADEKDVKILLENSNIQGGVGVSYKTILLYHLLEDIYYNSVGKKLKVTSIYDNYNDIKTGYNLVDPVFILEDEPKNDLLKKHCYKVTKEDSEHFHQKLITFNNGL